MDKCKYFKESSTFIQSAERHSHMQVTGTSEHRKWCDHPKHSPFPKAQALTTGFSSHALTCGGDIAKCQIDAENFGDVT
jgi:hypothetical protein